MCNRARCTQIASVFAECRTYVGRCAIAVIGQCLNDNRNAAGAITFVAHFVISFAVVARCFVNRALDIILGHRLRLGGIDRKAQTRVKIRIGHAHFRSNRYFPAKL